MAAFGKYAARRIPQLAASDVAQIVREVVAWLDEDTHIEL
jgi:hypothetical protein